MAHEPGPHRLLAVNQLSSRPGVPSLRRALSGRPPTARLHLLGPVSGDGFRPVDLSRKSARHRSWFGFVAAASCITWDSVARWRARRWRMRTNRGTGASSPTLRRVLIATARGLYVREPMGVALEQSLYALDSTTIDLCLSLFPWARFRRRKAAVKMHTLLDLRGNIPTFIRITDGKVHDVNILDEIMPEAGAFYVMDRGYVDFERLFATDAQLGLLRGAHQVEPVAAAALLASRGQEHGRPLRSHRDPVFLRVGLSVPRRVTPRELLSMLEPASG